jgi:hypothetical protein
LSKSNQDGSNKFGPLAQQLILTNQGPFNYQGNIISDLQSVQLRNQSIYAISRIPLGQAWELSLGARRQTQSYNNFDSNKHMTYKYLEAFLLMSAKKIEL